MSRRAGTVAVIAAMCAVSVLLALGPRVCWRVLPGIVPIALAIELVDSGR